MSNGRRRRFFLFADFVLGTVLFIVGVALVYVSFRVTIETTGGGIALGTGIALMTAGLTVIFGSHYDANAEERHKELLGKLERVTCKTDGVQAVSSDEPPLNPSDGWKESLRNIAIYCLVLLLIAIPGAILAQLGLNFQSGVEEVRDISVALLTLNGVLLGLIATFSTIYVSLVDNRRIDSKAASKENSVIGDLNKALNAAQTYRNILRDFSYVIVLVGLSFGLLLGLSFGLYLLSYAGDLPLWGQFLFAISAASPIITIGDFLIVMGYILFDLAGRPLRRQLEIMRFQTDDGGTKRQQT